MPAEALDMALDDLVQNDRKPKGQGRGKGKGKGKGKSFQLWGGSKISSGKGGRKGGRSAAEKKESSSDGKKLDMSLDEVIEKDKGRGKGGKARRNEDGNGKGKSRGKGKRDDRDAWGGYSKGKGYNKGRDSWDDDRDDRRWSKGKGKGKSYGKDRGYSDRYSSYDSNPAWNEHDDRDDEEGGYGGGRSAGGFGRGGDDRFAGRVRSSAPGGWQTVEQPRAPIRDSRRDREREERIRSSKVVESRGIKRRATEEPVSSRSIKSIKVTNIPRGVSVEDIREAFEQETGKIARCRMDKGTAWIAFLRAADARKAIETFDRGELNGSTIGCVLDA